MYLLGIDVGTSSIKVSVVEAGTRKCVASASFPDTESGISAPFPGWAEQHPGEWWEQVKQAILRANSTKKYDPLEIAAIGIAYQMHGLVLVDKNGRLLRDSIIWCDSRAVALGDNAFDAIGHEKCLSSLLNSPGNFTASKFAWVKLHEPGIFDRTDKLMLPGDFIALMLTGEITTSPSALSEGIFWDFQTNGLSEDVMAYFGFDPGVIPAIQPVFSDHGRLKSDVAALLGMKPGIPVSYKAGDQPNNALSLNVMQPGEVAATAGTSGVIYGISSGLISDRRSRINTFAHVNHSAAETRTGALLCINGTGILNRWAKDLFSAGATYNEMNAEGNRIAPGSDGLRILPFGNGAERMLENRIVAAHIQCIDLNRHTRAHLFRAVQEGIAFAFRYGLDIMRENGMQPSVIRAGRTNLFLSRLFTETFVNVTGIPVELYDADGSTGAALGAGYGAGIYHSEKEAFHHESPLETVLPQHGSSYEAIYREWKNLLEAQLKA
jgi:xylulokinase